MPYAYKNELAPYLLGTCSLNPWPGNNSSSRVQMFASHLTQMLVMEEPSERGCQTGMEAEYGKYTFNVKMPADAEVLKIIPRYTPKIGEKFVTKNPQSIVVYEDVETKEVGIVNITEYFSNHQYFGYRFKQSDALKSMRVGDFVSKDTILLDSPNVTKDGGYMYGRELNVAFMSHPAVAEDGFMICEDVLHKLAYRTYETRVIDFGRKKVPLNLYGNEDEYKAFPNIGDMVREDGIIMALRDYNDDISPVEQSVYDLMEIDHTFDKSFYVTPGGRVVDIKVYHDKTPVEANEVFPMEVQPNAYNDERIRFYKSILAEHDRLLRLRGKSLKLSRPFHNLIIEAMVAIDSDQKRLIKLYRQVPLDDWRIEIVIENINIPTIGNKITGCHG